MRILAKIALSVVLLLAGVICVHLFSFSTATDPDLDYQRQFNERYRIFSLSPPEDLSFCGEAVPMNKIDVRERLDRELLVNTYWQSNSVLAHKRAHRWFPVIEPILAREGVPDDLKYIALIESGLTNVISPVGATGYWQFMKETGIAYGLRVDEEVDERYNVVRSTEAACRYLKASKERFGSWAMAAAGYNLGHGHPGHEGDHHRSRTLRLPSARKGPVSAVQHALGEHHRADREPERLRGAPGHRLQDIEAAEPLAARYQALQHERRSVHRVAAGRRFRQAR